MHYSTPLRGQEHLLNKYQHYLLVVCSVVCFFIKNSAPLERREVAVSEVIINNKTNNNIIKIDNNINIENSTAGAAGSRGL